MKFRRQTSVDAFDGLTADEVRRIRGAGEASVTPGLDGFGNVVTEGVVLDGQRVDAGYTVTPLKSTDVLPVRKRGRRA